MSYAYAEPKKKSSRSSGPRPADAAPQLDALRSGAAQPTSAQLGHRIDLSEAMRARMEGAFGANLSGVQLYESKAVENAGAEAVAQGNRVAFAPGKANFSSRSGQELLGHELSHVVSQARGEVTGRGFLNNSALEARADREGAMAAAGEQIHASAAPMGALSTASAAPAAGPMQAKKKKGKKEDEPAATAPEEADAAEEETPAAAQEETPAAAQEQTPAADQEEKEQNANGVFSGISSVGSTVLEQFGDQYSKAGDTFTGAAEKAETDEEKAGFMQAGLSAQKTSSKLGIANSALGLTNGLLGFGEVMGMQGAIGDAGTKTMRNGLKYGSGAAGLGLGAAGLGLGAQISGLKALNSVGDEAAMGNHLATAGGLGMGAGILGLGAQTLGLGASIDSTRNAAQIQKNMSSNAAALQSKKDKGEVLSEDQDKMRKIFNQASGQARINKIQGGFDIASGALGIGKTAATMGGAAPVASVLGGASSAVKTIGKGVTEYEKDKFQKSTVEDELNIKQNLDDYAQDEDTAHIWDEIGEKERKTAFLRNKGFASGKVGEAFEGITNDRTNYILGKKKDDADRRAFMDAAQINDKSDNPLAPKLTKSAVHSALGGDEKAKYDDMFGDDFQKTLDQDAEDKKNGLTTGKKIKNGLKWFFTKAIPGSFKSLGGKLAGAAMGIGRGIKKGAIGLKNGVVSAAKGIKNLATSKEARANAWQGIKSGFGKVGSGIKKGALAVGRGLGKVGKATANFMGKMVTDPMGTLKDVGSKVGGGLKKAGKYVGGMLKTQGKKISRWYNHGMEQLVMNKKNYDKMGGFDRFLWSVKNLPARIAYNFKGARDKTAGRLGNVLKAQALMRYADEKRKKQAS